jgi:hypothetical protein
MSAPGAANFAVGKQKEKMKKFKLGMEEMETTKE